MNPIRLSTLIVGTIAVACTGSIGGVHTQPGDDGKGGQKPQGGNVSQPPGGEAGSDGSGTGGKVGGGSPSGGQGGEVSTPNLGPPPPVPAYSCAKLGDKADRPRLWRLSPTQYRHAMYVMKAGRGVVGNWNTAAPQRIETEVPFDGINGGDRFVNFARAFTMNDAEFWRALESSDDYAHQLSATFGGGCLAKATTLAAFSDCTSRMLGTYGPLAFGRPLSADELTRYANVGSSTFMSLGSAEAGALVLQAIFTSPHFLYRAEGLNSLPDENGVVRLTQYEIASALGYTLTDSPPDDGLWNAAKTGALATSEQIGAQVERLLALKPSKFAPTPYLRFFQEFTHYTLATGVFKEKPPIPHNPLMLLSDLDSWFYDLRANKAHGGFWSELLLSPTGFVRGDYTGANFDLSLPRTNESGIKMNLDPARRAGILTQPGFLIAFSENEHTQPVQRGKFIRESFLCGEVPPLPIGGVPPQPDLGPKATARDRLNVHSQTPGCNACHQIMDPLGLPFELYDDLGRYRTTENGTPIDATGEITDVDDATDGKFTGVVELAKKLHDSRAVSECFVRHNFRYWMGRTELENDEETVARMHQAFSKNDGDLVGMLTTLFTSSTFLTRCVQ